MEIEVTGEIFHWRGPAPHHFVALPDEASELLAELPELSYGWGCIPVRARIGATGFETSLMPKDGRYLLPIKVAVRRAEELNLGDVVFAQVQLRDPGPFNR